MKRVSIRVPGGAGFCNAIRRSLLSDIQTEAACNVRFLCNTTFETDEFIAHRIGLIPLKRVGNGNTFKIDVTGPATVTTADFVGPAFEAVHSNIDIIPLSSQSRLHCVVTVDTQRAAKHARYSPCAGVGMRANGDGTHTLSFESNDTRTAHELLRDAFEHTERRLQNALHQLAHQPTTPPTSFC